MDRADVDRADVGRADVDRADKVVAGTVTALAVIGLVVGRSVEGPSAHPLGPLVVSLSLAQGLLLLQRRRRPLPVLLCTTAAVVALGLLRHPIAGVAVGPLAATYAVGAYATTRWAVVSLAPVVAALAAVGVGFSVSSGREGPGSLDQLASGAVLFGAVFLAGRLVRSRREAAAQRTRAAVAEERVRIARELHDVVAHHVGVMALHAGAGRRLVEADPEAARQAFAQIEASGREALAAMPALVGSLRQGGTAAMGPQPTLADVDRLVADRAAAGQQVTLHVEGDPTTLPAPVELSGYRIVQEALTNAGRHAGSAAVSVRIRYADDALHLDIEDDGPGGATVGRTGAGVTADAAGFGLTGMRERVRSLGGSCQIGERPGGGFAVRVVLPRSPAGVR